MLTIHHLADSRSQRILWLMEELGEPYEVVRYERDPQSRFAPPGLKGAHPLGKAPAAAEGGLLIHESGAIVEYAITRAGGRLRPEAESADFVEYLQWMHYAEGSAMTPLLLHIYAGRIGEGAAPLLPRIREQLDLHLGYIDRHLDGREFFVGRGLTGADVMMSFPIELAGGHGLLGGRDAIKQWMARMQGRPAYRTALERGGPYSFAG